MLAARRRTWAWLEAHAYLCVALFSLLITSGTAVFVGVETRCQRQVNRAAALESAAAATLEQAIFLSDDFESQLIAYDEYVTTLDAINRQRTQWACVGPIMHNGISALSTREKPSWTTAN